MSRDEEKTVLKELRSNARVPEPERHIDVLVLIIRRQEDAYLMASTEASRIGNKRNAIADFLSDRHGVERGTRKHGNSGLARRFMVEIVGTGNGHDRLWRKSEASNRRL